jgi:hypothetical protein
MRSSRARRTRGGALLIAVLVVLVLTVVGLGLAYFTQLEDQTSGNIRLSKMAFYSAEVGLRTGEQVISGAIEAAVSVKSLVYYTGGGGPVTVPGGGLPAVPLHTAGLGDLLNQVVPAPAGANEIAVYSLYVRDNEDDPGRSKSPPESEDTFINLVSIGRVYATRIVAGNVVPDMGRLLTEKVLEEQINLTLVGAELGAQKGGDASGTGTGQTGG